MGLKGNPTGKIIHHDLSKSGFITYYDIRFGKKVVRNIPAELVESIEEHTHEHEERE